MASKKSYKHNKQIKCKKTNKVISCAGVIILNESLDQTVVVIKVKNNKNVSFPKGTIEGKDNGSKYTAATRELFEETDIRIKDIEPLFINPLDIEDESNLIYEFKENGNISCVYYVAICKTLDIFEGIESKYRTIYNKQNVDPNINNLEEFPSIMSTNDPTMISQRRFQVLQKAIEYVNEYRKSKEEEEEKKIILESTRECESLATVAETETKTKTNTVDVNIINSEIKNENNVRHQNNQLDNERKNNNNVKNNNVNNVKNNNVNNVINFDLEETNSNPLKIRWVSKYLCKILRHELLDHNFKESFDVDMKTGYVKVDSLLKNVKDFVKCKVTLQMIKNVVEQNDKQRFKLILSSDPEHDHDHNGGKYWIKANQGHSKKFAQYLNNDINLTCLQTLDDFKSHGFDDYCIHGTQFGKGSATWNSIKLNGLSRMERQHIHFVPFIDPKHPKIISGMKKQSNIFIYVDVAKALANNIKFYLSDNNVILTSGDSNGFLRPEFFKKVLQLHKKKDLIPLTYL